MSTVKTTGRLVYIEPNDLVGLDGKKGANGVSAADGVSWNAEELNMSVDLQVIIPNREDCGQVSFNKTFLVNINNDKSSEIGKYVSFLSGSDIHRSDEIVSHELTTSYVDASYQEIKNNHKSNKECLGIESIDITFDSHFYPNVNIKFIDVRGYSLMMPTEEQYRESLNDKQNGTNNAGAYTNFFRALFHFPYPRFLLTVKGYYGNSITFMLAPNEFHNQFNSSTGNFEINVSFIGYMYGLYTDLPFNLLMCAPYLGVDTADGETKGKYWTDGNYQFTDENGNANGEVQTYVDFIKSCDALARVKQQIQEGTSDNETINEASKLNQEDSKWQEIIDKIHKFLDTGIEPNKKHTVLKHKDGNGNVADVLVLGDMNDVVEYDTTAWKSIADDLNKSLSSVDATKILNANFCENNKIKEVLDLKTKYPKASDPKKNDYIKRHFSDIYNALESKPYRKNYNTLSIEFDTLLYSINNRKNRIADQINSNSPEIQAEVQQVYSDSLGFDPTIQNIYRMLFAHVDCFMQSFYDLLGKIKSSNRKLKDIGISDKDLTDLNRKSTSDAFVPPFTAFFKMNGNKREMVYPKDLGGSVKLAEVDYIEDLLQGVLSAKINVLKYLAQASTVEQYNNELQTGAGGGGVYTFEPTMITDFWRNGGNPYANLTSDPNNNDKYLAELVYYYLLRVAGAGAQGFKQDISEVEAKNFVNLHKQIPGEKFKQQLEACKNDDNAINTLLNSIKDDSNLMCKPYEKDGTWYITSPTPLYIDGFKQGDKKNAAFIQDKNKNTKLFAILDESHNDEVTKFQEAITSNDTLKKSIDLTSKNVIGESVAVIGRHVTNWISSEIAKNKKDEYVFLRLLATIAFWYKYRGFNMPIDSSIKKFIIFDILFSVAATKDRDIFWEDSSRNLCANIDGEKISLSINASVVENSGKNPKFQEYYNNFLKSQEFKKIIGLVRDKNNYDFDKKQWKANFEKQLKDYFNKIVCIVNVESNKLNNGESLKTIKNFLSKISEAYNSGEGGGVTAEAQAIQDIEDIKASDLSETHKLAVYNTLKNLYDKWANSYTKEDFVLREPSSDYSVKKSRYETGTVDFSNDTKEYDNFLFVDSYYNDISNKFRINPRTVYDLVRSQMEGSSNYSTYEFMADLCQKNELLFLALPVYNNFYSVEGIKNIFNPQIEQSMKTGFGSTYICMHTYEVSHVVEDESDTGMCDDGIDIAAITDDAAPMNLKQLFEHSGNGLSLQVPAFGVTYALQNQQYFKSINVNMDNPRVTDYSIQNTLMLASPGSDNTLQKPAMAANDLYSIYANRSYNCTVDMMGCANIMPMMYFQLNNIPMFRGGYMITNVSHHIAPGDFTTSFTGVRISKNQLPFNDQVFNLNSLLNLEGGMMGTVGCMSSGVSCTGSFDPQKAVARMSQRVRIDIDGTKPFHDWVIPMNGKGESSDYKGGCATAVQTFLCAGFGHPSATKNDRASHGFSGCNGWECRDQLLNKRGFSIIYKKSNCTKQDLINFEKTVTFLAGDVAVMNATGRPYGHICMYNGSNWVSDTKQNGCAYCYSSKCIEIWYMRFHGCSSSSGGGGGGCFSSSSSGIKPLPINVALGIGICNGEKGGSYIPSHAKVQPKTSDIVSTYHLAGLKLGFTGTYLQSLVKVIEQVWRYYNRDGLKTLYHIVGNWNIGNPNAKKNNPVVPNANVDYYRASVSRYMQMRLDTNITFNEETICKLVEVMCMIERSTNVTSFSHQAYKAAGVPH